MRTTFTLSIPRIVILSLAALLMLFSLACVEEEGQWNEDGVWSAQDSSDSTTDSTFQTKESAVRVSGPVKVPTQGPATDADCRDYCDTACGRVGCLGSKLWLGPDGPYCEYMCKDMTGGPLGPRETIGFGNP